MASSVNFDLIDSVALFDGIERLALQSRSSALAQFAAVQIAEVDSLNASTSGSRIAYETYVDGKKSRNLSSVRPDGIIVAEWEFGVEIVDWIYKALREKSPVLKGKYRDSITIFADDIAVGNPAAANGASQVVIMATVPYARKLEGISGAKYTSSKAPDGVFQVVQAIAKGRFGNQAKIMFTYRGVLGTTSVNAWATGRAAKNMGSVGTAKAKRQRDKDVRNPAILIMFK